MEPVSKDPRLGVNPGDPLALAASQVNFLNRLMAADTSFGGGPMNGWRFGRTTILARNDTGQPVPRWGVLAISGVVINPTTNDNARRSFEEMPCVSGDTPSESTGARFVIAIEPIAPGKIGRVAAAGVVQAKVQILDAGHASAQPKAGSRTELESAEKGPAQILWAAGAGGVTWALVRFGGGGGGSEIRVGKVDVDWPIGECATVAVWETYTQASCLPAVGNEQIADVANLSFNVPADSWVVIGKAANGRWYLIEAGKEGTCRQTIGGEDVTKWPGWNGSATQLLGHDANGCLKWIDVETCSTPYTPGGP